MRLTAAKWDRVLLPGRTFHSSLMSLRSRLWKACVLRALQDQSQLWSNIALALAAAYTRCHGCCKNWAFFFLLSWPGLNTNWSLHCAALLCPSTPSKAKTKPMLLTNRFICILTGAQILDTDFFCTTVQEPVQNMLFFIHVQKNPNPNWREDKECGSIYSQLVCLSLQSTHLPSPIMPISWSTLPVSNGCIVSEER